VQDCTKTFELFFEEKRTAPLNADARSNWWIRERRRSVEWNKYNFSFYNPSLSFYLLQ